MKFYVFFYFIVCSTIYAKFTDTEQKWIEKKIPITYVYDPDWAPFEWRNEIEQHTGIISDLIKIISRKTNIKFIAINTKDWAESVRLAESGKVDMYSAIPEEGKRKKYINFSKEIFGYRAVLIKNKNNKKIYTKSNLNNENIVIVKGSALGKFIKNKFTNANYIEVKSTNDGFEKIKNNEDNLFAINSATANYFINRDYRDILVVAKEINYKFSLKIGISKEMPKEVISIINKALDTISIEKKEEIYNKWIKKDEKKVTNWSLLYKIIGGFIFTLLLLVIYNKKLRSVVNSKTKELQIANKSLEEKFKEQKSLLSLFDKGDVALLKWKLDELKLIYVSKSVNQLFGYTINEFLTSRISYEEIIDKRDFENVKTKMLDAIRNKKDFTNSPYRIITKSGKVRWVINNNSFVKDENGKISYLLIHITDITSLKELEIKISQQKEILQQQSKLAMMGEMIGSISHQWRQPLNALSINIQSLKYDYEDKLINKEFIKEFIKENRETITFMSKTIDDFRNFFKVNKHKKNFNVKKAIEFTISILSSQLANNDISLEIKGEEFYIHGFKGEFQQVILNIISNAKDAAIENKIKNRKIEIVLESPNIKIIDNSGGIPKDIVDRVFEPYFTTKEQGKGTGIGLYMSKMIIENNMGGLLTVSNKNNGAEFIISMKKG